MQQNEAPKAVYLKDYAVPAFLIDAVELEFDLEPENTRVTSTMQVRRNPAAGSDSRWLVLNGEQLRLVSIELDGRPVSTERYSVDQSSLRIDSLPDSFTLRTEVLINPAANTTLEGLYVSSGNFCTQCEAEGFRKISYYPDRPDVMARFSTLIRADRNAYPVLLSNGNRVEAGVLDDGRHFVRWEDPFPKPCYLFALVAGRLSVIEDKFITRSGREVLLQIFVQPHNADKCGHAMDSLKNAMRWDEQTFGLEYDLDIYMIVAVDDFNMGAMENKGLNIFNSKFVLARPDTATDTDYQQIEGVIGHEYFHNWTGNRVTCRDWFQLSLKEGLTVFRDQQFSAAMSTAAVKRIDDVRMLRTVQFAEDAGPMAHPVRPESFIEINNFYTVTVYEKGAEVIRMQQTILGEKGFRDGLALYFERHDGQAVTIEDFVAAMEDANNADLKQFRLWYSQAGTPRLTVRDNYDEHAGTYTLSFHQHCPDTPGQAGKQPMHVPVAVGLLAADGRELPLYTADGQQAQDTLVLHLTQEEQEFTFLNIPEQPVPSLLRGFSAPVKLEYPYTDQALRLLMVHDADSFGRWEAAQRYALNNLLELIETYRANQPLQAAPAFISACADLLHGTEQRQALLAEALLLPGEKYLSEQLDTIDAAAVHAAREFLLGEIAKALYPQLERCYEQLSEAGPYRTDPASMGRRRLRNLCLAYMVQTQSAEAIMRCVSQYQNADNMTDRLVALGLLVGLPGEHGEAALQDFYQRFHQDTLVLDKWFSIQATSKRSNTLERVRALSEHEAFSMKNPNKVRALWGAFCMSNPVRFHDSAGEGYVFLADCVLRMDTLNPQIASRLAGGFAQCSRLVEPNRSLMQGQLERILNTPGLSRDTYEIVSKSLKN